MCYCMYVCISMCAHIPLRIGNVHERCIVQVCHSFTINHLSSVGFYLTDQCDAYGEMNGHESCGL